MKIFPLIVVAIVGLSASTTRAAGTAPAALKTFLEQHGYGGSALQRRFGNHLFVETSINGHGTALMIDTGCPFTLIDRNSAHKLGLESKLSKDTVTGITGNSQPLAISRVASLAMGNCTFQNVPVGIAAEGDINRYARPHLDGLFGAHEMAKFGMVVDCSRQMLYVNPRGSAGPTSQELVTFLQARGFVRVPMHFDSSGHLEVDAQINFRTVKLIVDTGAFTTLISTAIAEGSGAAMDPSMSDYGKGIGRVGELSIGSFKINNAEVYVADMYQKGGGLLGEDYLSWNFGVIDLGGMNLFLRHPEETSAKKG